MLGEVQCAWRSTECLKQCRVPEEVRLSALVITGGRHVICIHRLPPHQAQSVGHIGAGQLAATSLGARLANVTGNSFLMACMTLTSGRQAAQSAW